MDHSVPHGQPAEVFVEQGMVLIDGPGGLALTLTADAAEETGRRLIQAAERARATHGPHDNGGRG